MVHHTALSIEKDAQKEKNRRGARGDDQSGNKARRWQWAQKFLFSALLSVLVGLCTYHLNKAPRAEYEAEAKLLLLSPQDQFLPSDGFTTVAIDSNQTSDILVEAHALLTSPDLLNQIVDQYGLYNDKAFTHTSLLVDLLTGVGVLDDLSPSARAVKSLKQRIKLNFNEARHLLEVSVVGTTADQATVLANVMAQSYLELKKSSQTARYDSALLNLKSDIDNLQAKIDAEKQQLLPREIPLSLQGEEAVVWNAQESERRALLQNRISAKSGIMVQLLTRYEEAQTRLSLDLLPPKVRLLSQATAPEMPLKSDAFDLSIKVTFASFLLFSIFGVAFFSFRSKVQSNDSDFTMPLDIKSQQAMLETAFGAELPQVSEETDASADLDTLPSLREVAARQELLVKSIARKLLEGDCSRIVLLSDEQSWSDYIDQIVDELSLGGTSVAYVNLDHQEMDVSEDRSGKPLGLSDLVDGLADCGEITRKHLIEGLAPIAAIASGSRPLISSDFLSPEIHAFFLALENAYDRVIIDIGPHFEDEFALKSLGLSPKVMACIHAPDTHPDLIEQVRDVMSHFGYHQCLIVPQDMADEVGLQMAPLGTQAA